MAIEVKHGVSPAAAAAAAFGGAQGRARQRAALGGAAAATRLEQGALAREARARETGLAREFQAGQAALGHERGLERQTFAAGLQQEAAVAAQGRRRADLEFSRTAKQEADLKQMAEAEAAALASPDFTEEEKVEIRRRFAARRAGIRPVERPRELTPAEKHAQSTHTDKAGRIFSLDKDGRIGKLLHTPPERAVTFRDRVDAVRALTPAFTTQTENGPKVDRAGLNRAVEEMVRAQAGLGPSVDPQRVAQVARSLRVTPDEARQIVEKEQRQQPGGGLRTLEARPSDVGAPGVPQQRTLERRPTDVGAPGVPQITTLQARGAAAAQTAPQAGPLPGTPEAALADIGIAGSAEAELARFRREGTQPAARGGAGTQDEARQRASLRAFGAPVTPGANVVEAVDPITGELTQAFASQHGLRDEGLTFESATQPHGFRRDPNVPLIRGRRQEPALTEDPLAGVPEGVPGTEAARAQPGAAAPAPAQRAVSAERKKRLNEIRTSQRRDADPAGIKGLPGAEFMVNGLSRELAKLEAELAGLPKPVARKRGAGPAGPDFAAQKRLAREHRLQEKIVKKKARLQAFRERRQALLHEVDVIEAGPMFQAFKAAKARGGR